MEQQTDYFASPDTFDITDGLEHYSVTEGAVLLDVRMKAEFNEGHIPGAVCVPLQKIETRIGKVIPDRETPVFTYCVTGARSGRAASIMRSMGYEHVYNIGGILGYNGDLE